MKLDFTSLYIEMAEAFILWRQYVDASDALAIAHKQLSPQRMRQQVTILVAEAKLYNAQGYYDDGADSALQAWRIVQAVGMGSKEQQIRALLPQYVKHVPTYDATRQLVQRLEMG